MRPRLKNAVWHRGGDDLYVISDPEEQIVLADPDGQVERLLSSLANCGPDSEGMAEALGDVDDAIMALDSLRLLTDADAPAPLTVASASAITATWRSSPPSLTCTVGQKNSSVAY